MTEDRYDYYPSDIDGEDDELERLREASLKYSGDVLRTRREEDRSTELRTAFEAGYFYALTHTSADVVIKEIETVKGEWV